MSEAVKKLADTIVGAARKRLGSFLDENPDALAFLKERATRMAELSVKYALAPEAERAAIESEMEAVQLAIATESLNVALDADEGARGFFRDVLDVVFGFAKDALPVLLKGLKFISI